MKHWFRFAFFGFNRSMKNPHSEVQKIFKPGNIGELLLGWLIHAHKSRQRHDLAARRCDRIRLWVGGPAAVFSAIVGTSVFAALEKNASGAARSMSRFTIVIAAIGIAAAILTGLNTFLNLSERAEKHRSAGVRYKEVIRELERIASGGADSSTHADPLTTGLQKRLDELEESAPIVPERIYDRVEKEWKKRGMKFVTTANELYQSDSDDAGPHLKRHT